MQVQKTFRHVWLVVGFGLLLLSLSSCASLHDGKGFEHKPGESEIKHKH